MSAQRDLQRALEDYRKAQKQLDKYTDELPRVVGVEAVRWIHDNFEKQGYMGNTWDQRKASTNAQYDKRSGVKGSVFNSGNPILMQTNNLYDAIRHKEEGRRTFVGFDTNKVPYGRIHNEGGTISKTGAWHTIYFSGGRFASKYKTGKEAKGKYAGEKNEGRNVLTAAHEIKEPQRQFMPRPDEPENQEIMDRVLKKIKARLLRIMRKFEK